MSSDGERDTVIMKLFADEHTIEIGHGFLLNSHDNFLSDLKSELGPQSWRPFISRSQKKRSHFKRLEVTGRRLVKTD